MGKLECGESRMSRGCIRPLLSWTVFHIMADSPPSGRSAGAKQMERRRSVVVGDFQFYS
jgi:hypothetical protein